MSGGGRGAREAAAARAGTKRVRGGRSSVSVVTPEVQHSCVFVVTFMRVRPRLVVQTSHTSLVGQRRARGASDGARAVPLRPRLGSRGRAREARAWPPRDARAVGRPSGARTRAARGSSSRMSRGVPSSRRDARSRARPRDVEHRAARPLARRARLLPNAARRLARRRGGARDARLLAPRARSRPPPTPTTIWAPRRAPRA